MPEAFPAWFTAKPESPSGEAISLLPTIVSITVVRDPASPLLKPIPIGVFPATPPGSARQLTLGPGNVFLLAQQIATNSPADSITGFRIKSGTLTFPANITVVSGVVHIAPAETIQLDAVLDPPAAPPPVAGPGADATAAVATLPASVRIVFAPAGGQITRQRATNGGLVHPGSPARFPLVRMGRCGTTCNRLPPRQLDRYAEAGNCSDARCAGRSAPTRTNPTNRCLSGAGLNVRIHSAPGKSRTNTDGDCRRVVPFDAKA
jgi:hypothetical protein